MVPPDTPMDRVALATIYHDPHGHLPGRIAELWPRVGRLFEGLAVVVTRAGAQAGIDLLRSFGARLDFEDHPPAGLDGIGRARRLAVAAALQAGADRVMYADLDHVLRWGEHDPADLQRTVEASGAFDLCVVGRSPAAIDALPATLRDTEAVVNRVFSSVSGRAWDVMSGVRVMSRAGAQEIVDHCAEDSVANDVVWPLHALAAGLRVGYVEAPALVYEDDEQFASRQDPQAWRARLEADPQGWALRLRVALMDVEAMVPYAGPR